MYHRLLITTLSFLLMVVGSLAVDSCPPRAVVKPCLCQSDGKIPRLVNVTCSHARSWYRVKEVLRHFRGSSFFIQSLHIERVEDVRTDRLIRGIFRKLTIGQLSISDSSIVRWRKDAFINTTVYSLSVVAGGLRQIPARSLSNARHVQELSLANNLLTDVDANGFQFAADHLALLDLKYNRLSAVPRGALAALPKLEILVLSHNSIRSIGQADFVDLKNLLALELSHNPLVRIEADSLVPLVSLKHVGLAGVGSDQLSAAVRRVLSRLVSLDVSNASVDVRTLIGTSRPHRLESLVAQTKDLSIGDLVNLTSLVDLDIRGSGGAQAIARRLPAGHSFASVERLDISETKISLDSLAIFPNARVVFMNNNPTGGGYVDNHLMRPISRIGVLHMENCGIKEISAYALWPLRLTLKELNLSYNKLRRLNWRSLFPLTALKSLDLSYNEFRDRVGKGLSLRNNATGRRRRGKGGGGGPAYPLNKRLLPPGVEVLSLAGNGLQRLPQRLLAGLMQLKHLNVAGNELRSIDAELQYNRKLIELNLNNNRIGQIHPRAFARLRRLRHLNLGWNPIGNISAIKFPAKLEYLGLTRTLLKSVDGATLLSLDRLHHLDLSYNGFRTMVDGRSSSAGGSGNGQAVALPSSLIYLDLEGNPLDCSCHLMPLINWLSEQMVTLSTTGTICYTPLSLRFLHPMRDMCWSACSNWTDNLQSGRRHDSSKFCKAIQEGVERST